MLKRIVFCLVIFFVLNGCNAFEYHPYDTKLENKYKNINNRNIERLKQLDKGFDTVRFAFMGDSQRWYDETRKFVNHINQRNDIDFVVHGGDISDFGMKKEFCWIHDIMDRLDVPYVAIIGNHDNLGSGGEIYQTMYGDLNFSFIYGKIKFVCLNTNALEFDYSVPVPDFQFIRKEIVDSVSGEYTQSIALMHAEPGDTVFNNNVKEVFHEYIKRLKNLRFCLHAHAHRIAVDEFFNDGIIYYGCAEMKSLSYLLFTVTADNYTYEIVHF